jgi:hypothetical protein
MSRVATPRAGVQRKPARPAHGLARLMLVVNGTSYVIRTIPCDPAAALKAFRLRKVDGTVYHIALNEHGPVCDCPDFVFHRDGIDPDGCKHIKAMTAVGLLDAGKGGAK